MDKKINITLYWKCQVVGWSVAALYWGYIGFTGTDFNWFLAVIHFAADLSIYISLSHLFRSFSLKYKWQKLSIKKIMIRLAPAILVLGFAFMILTLGKNYLIRLCFQQNFSESFRDSLDSQGLTTFVTGTRLMAIWVLAYYGYHFSQREVIAVREGARLSMIAKDAEFNNLSAQLNPHFFFNSLNSIKGLVVENPGGARRAIDLLSDLMRTSLYGRGTGMIAVKDEIEMVKDYLELEQVRFEKRLGTNIEVDELVPDRLILPFSIQVLVENAIKHGIAQRKEGGTIYIRVEEDKGFLHAVIQNPGKLDTAATKGLGLKNLKERLQLQFDGKASFDITQQGDGTVSATFRIPLA